MGIHEYIPGVASTLFPDSLIIGESKYREFVGNDTVDNYNTTNWIFRIDGLNGEALKALGSRVEADSRVGSVLDWTTEHEAVERNGGLIFGTPGLLIIAVCSSQCCSSCLEFRIPFIGTQSKKERVSSSSSNRC